MNGADPITGAILVFCRVGACLMVMPGASSLRVPARIRLFLAIGSTIALIPTLDVGPAVDPSLNAVEMARLITREVLLGAVIGFCARLFVLAMEFIGVAIAHVVGFAGIPGVPIDEGDAAPPLAALFSLLATLVFLLLDLHLQVLIGLHESYAQWPMAAPIDTTPLLSEAMAALTTATAVVIRIGAPFLILGIMANFVFALVNRLVPSVPFYFLTVPIILWAGLFMLQLSIGDLLRIYAAAAQSWFAR
jgi:flagellar biosynthetic protein FliR